MGTVLSFSPRERRTVYSTHHPGHNHQPHHRHSHHGSSSSSSEKSLGGGGNGGLGMGMGGTLSNSTSADFPLNNFSTYEHLNNVKNRENSLINLKQAAAMSTSSSANYLGSGHNLPNAALAQQNHQNQQQIIGNLMGSLQITNNNISADTARILSEKNALEKNLKKHSLFINALSWKRLASGSHGKKKMDNCNNNNNNNIINNNNNNITTNNKNKTNLQHLQHHQMQLAQLQQNQMNNNNNNNYQQTHLIQGNGGGGGVGNPYAGPGHNQNQNQNSAGLMDLVRANNTNNNSMDKLVTKLPISLPIQHPNAPANNNNGHLLITSNLNNNTSHSNLTSNLNHTGHGPRKTVIQVSEQRSSNARLFSIYLPRTRFICVARID